MSSFGHGEGVIKNPVFGSELFEDPAHTAAGKVLKENRNTLRDNSMESFGIESQAGKQASGLSGIAKFVLVLVVLVSATAIVLSLLLVTGTINISDGSASQQEGT